MKDVIMPSVSALTAHAIALSADHVFGVMGHGNAHFIDAIERDTTATFTAVRHEVSAVAAADAFHRSGGTFAVATTTYGPGFTNTVTALAEAARARSPLVLVTGSPPTSGPRPCDVDQVAVAAAVGAPTYSVSRSDATATTLAAVEHARAHCVPVVLQVPCDVAALESSTLPSATKSMTQSPATPDPALQPETVTKVAQMVSGAQRPLLLAGRGAWLAGARSALGALAETTGAVTATTALGRSFFPEAKFDLGVLGGWGAAGALEVVRQADVVVVFGASLNEFTMRSGKLFAPDAAVIQVDLSPSATHPRVDEYVQGDADRVARALVDALATHKRKYRPWRNAIDAPSARLHVDGDPTGVNGRLDPRAVASRIGELLPADRVVVTDGGHFLGWPNMYWPVSSPNRLVMVGTAFQSIGLGFPSVAGAVMANPNSTIVLTTGDGGGLMALADLETAVRVARGRGIAVVWNDAAYSAEVHVYGQQGLSLGPMQIPQIDFAALATAVGARGVVVRELADLVTLEDWAASPPADRPFLLLDLMVSGEVVAPFMNDLLRVKDEADS